MAERFGCHRAEAQLTAGFMEQGVGDRLLQFLSEGIEVGLDREDADRAAIAIPMGMVMVVDELQVPDPLAAGDTAT